MNKLAVVPEGCPWTPDEVALIKSTVAKDATDPEFKLFLYRCVKLDLDPLKPGMIHFAKYGSNPGTIMIGIDGFRTKAARTGKHCGTKRGVLRDAKGVCIGAWAEVFRSDWKEPAREEVSLGEYHTGRANWVKMPETMIKKVAEAAALRMAFPDELGGTYAPEEMEQAEESHRHEPPAERVEPIEVEEVSTVSGSEMPSPGDFVIGWGRDKGKRIAEMPLEELKRSIEYWRNREKAHRQQLDGAPKAFVEAAEAFVKDME